uniref:Reverse transcriptase domain-containing protein n=1 Tax=Paramormyrops kingsleyae TaxID=1676925 RepID=A0A3B3RCJ5_9TELE
MGSTEIKVADYEKDLGMYVDTSISHSRQCGEAIKKANRMLGYISRCVQFKSREDAVTTVLHTVLSHLEQQGSYAQLLFIDFSSAFNTILPHTLVTKLSDIGLPHSTCRWIKDFLSDRTQRVRVGPYYSTPISMSTGSPQGCVLSPLLYTLYTHDCIPAHRSNNIVKFADDTTVVGLISGGDESAYRDEVEKLTAWCSNNNLLLNTVKTKELIVDFRKKAENIQPFIINGDCVEKVSDSRFLGVTISEDLTWGTHTSEVVKKTQKRLYFLRVLRKNYIPEKLLVSFYRCTVESIMVYCLCAWFSSCTVAQRKELHRIIKVAQRIVGCPLPSLEELHSSCCLRNAKKKISGPITPRQTFQIHKN